ncbi:MAG TPA: sigma 54-interacting transcriptional regulator [Bryobacteraceae bacterium]|nr:sigma 54-interacting transcriptional regulator [Bryobacteraceae bacterium]
MHSDSNSATAQAPANTWLVENGPNELELLLRAIVYHPSAPVIITDDQGNSKDASVGAGKLLGLSREQIIGRPVDDFADPGSKPRMSELWRALQSGEQSGSLRLAGGDAHPRDVEFTAKGSVLPVRNLLVLRDKTARAETGHSGTDPIPSWVQDYALYLLEPDGRIAAWYSGAARIYGYTAEEAVNEQVSLLYPGEDGLPARLQEEFRRTAAEGHSGVEGWQVRKEGSRFWANTIMVALKDENGELRGFARAVRDFTDRHDRDEKLRRSRARLRPVPTQSTIAGVVSGEFDRAPEANDAFLALVGYSRNDLLDGRLNWPDLTPAEYAPLDELAHEECLRFGACTPFEKELIRKDGIRVPVLLVTAVLKLSPFRWISFVQDLRDRERTESVEAEGGEPQQDFGEIVGVSAALRRVQRQVEVVAPTDATVLILGETGTGKELVARAVHRISPRHHLPFVTLNCAAIPTGLLESELFGYERGAFTGALSQKIGRFEMANRGTLFLDEVGDIPLDLQPKLLRALQEKAFERLGGTKTIPIDVRLVAATNRNLTQMMGDKLFRSDLYYRLKVFPITTPPLRDHAEDIPVLVRHFTKKYAEKMGRHIDKIPADTMRALVSWSWPGNVRELENFIERAVILSSGSSLRAPLGEIREAVAQSNGGATLEEVERDHIMKILRESDRVVTTAATRLGLHRTTLNAMMKKLGISRRDL